MTDLLSIFIKAVLGHEYASHRGQKGAWADCLFDYRSLRNALCNEHPHLTEEKISQLLSLYEDLWSKDPEGSDDRNFFYVLEHFVEDKATLHDNCIRVRLGELLRWRHLAYDIGEDVLACSWLAYRFRWTDQVKWNAEWNMSCEADDPDLQHLYGKGLADLHHHLKASTDVFSLSWICLMNHITHRYQAFGKMGTEKLRVPQLYMVCYKAAFVRVELYEYLRGNAISATILTEASDDYMLGVVV